VVAQQLALGDRLLVVVPTGEQDLVEVGELQPAALQLPRPAGAELVAVPDPIGLGSHLVVGPPAEHRAGVLLGVPSLDGVVVSLVQQQPLRLPGAVVTTLADQHEATAQLLGGDVEVQRALGDLALRVGVVGRRPGPPVPDDDVAAAVLAGGDDPFEVGVLDRVVLDLHGQPADRRVERRALGHGPAEQRAIELEAQVVVQAGGPMALHDESETPGRRGRRRTGRLRGAGEVTLGVVVSQPRAASVGVCWHVTSLVRRRPSTRVHGMSDSCAACRGIGVRWPRTA
jgi:hypothetical protein